MPFRYALSSFIPFRDEAACARVRAITRSEITRHANPNFRIEVIDERMHFYSRFAIDIVSRIQQAGEEGKTCVLILPVGPVPQYRDRRRDDQSPADQLRASRHVQHGRIRQRARRDRTRRLGRLVRHLDAPVVFRRIDAALRPPDRNIHFPTSRNIDDYWKMIEDEGGADCCYGGIGWCGHIAFWESHLGLEYAGDLAAYKQAHGRIVELNPMTIMQNALHSFGGDWSWVPPKAASIGPREILGARDRSFWLDGDQGGGVSWQRFIARLVAHGPVNELVPGSILQETNCGYHILGGVADDVRIDFS